MHRKIDYRKTMSIMHGTHFVSLVIRPQPNQDILKVDIYETLKLKLILNCSIVLIISKLNLVL